MEEKPSVFSELFHKYHEFIMYSIFGVSTTVVNWLVFSFCVIILPERYAGWFETIVVKYFHLDIKLVVAGLIAWIIAVIVAFITNKLWVFESKSWEHELVRKEAFTFFGGRIATGVLEIVAVPALVAWGFDFILFGVDGLPAKILVSISIVILNYLLSKFVSFKSPEVETENKKEQQDI